jgi:LacI family transcriptional regulator
MSGTTTGGPMSGRVTLADVARAADVDVSLVSRVVRGKDVKVRDETRERILEQVRLLGYRPNAIARSLKSARAGAFGLVIPNFENPVYAQIIAGAETAAARLGSVMMTTSGGGWEDTQWYDALDGGRVDGLLVAGGAGLDLSGLRVPYLLVNRTVPGVDRFVVLDDEGAARMAVEHLVGLGHRDLAFVGGPSEADTAARRQTGFEAAALAAGARSRVLPGDYTAAGGRAAVTAVLTDGEAPTAVVAANLPSGIGALEALRDAGVPVPGAVSVVAIHDAEIADFMVPKLTTVRMPLQQLGARAIEVLAALGPTDTVTDVVDAPMELVVRESTGPA